MQTAVEPHCPVLEIGISIGEMTNHHRKINVIHKNNTNYLKKQIPKFLLAN